MILSHKYKYIFLKTNKTAGTSFEIALSKHCGEEDIITPISESDERIRASLGYPGPQNFKIGKNRQFYNHVSAREVRFIVGDEIWNSYYKFCFERNPWERVISFYYWRGSEVQASTVMEFIHSGMVEILKKKGYGLYTDNDEIVVDRIYLYENMNRDIEKISSDIGLPEKLILPNAKTGFRKDRRHYSEILTPEEQSLIANIFSREIELFGY